MQLLLWMPKIESKIQTNFLSGRKLLESMKIFYTLIESSEDVQLTSLQNQTMVTSIQLHTALDHAIVKYQAVHVVIPRPRKDQIR